MQIKNVTDDLRVCLDPLLYEAINYRYRIAGNLLKQFPSRGHDIDDFGSPIIPENLRLDSKEEKQYKTDINKFIAEIYRLNGATRKLVQDKRDKLYDELIKFADLHSNETLENAKRQDSTHKPVTEIKDKKNNEPLNLSLDMSPEAQAGRAYLSEKRRTLNQMYLVTPFVPMLGVAGIAMAGPPYSVILLNANGMGLTHKDEEVRYGTICFLNGQVLSERDRYFFNVSDNTPDPFKPDHKYLAQEAISNLSFIANSLNRKNYGVYDSSERVSSKANDVQLEALKAIKEIREKAGLN